jgi:hypothetical protein
MDPISAPGGFLGEFVLTGILLPIVASFILDGVVLFLRGRSLKVLLIAALLTAAIVGLSSLAWQNGVATSDTSTVSLPDNMNGATQLVLLFSIPAAIVGFGLRMLALFLNPATKAADRALIAERKARRDRKSLKNAPAPVGVPAAIAEPPAFAMPAPISEPSRV